MKKYGRYFGKQTALKDELDKLKSLIYEKNIADLVQKAKILNLKVKAAGVTWRDIMLQKIPSSILKRFFAKDVPEDDDDFNELLILAGQEEEANQRRAKYYKDPDAQTSGKKDKKKEKSRNLADRITSAPNEPSSVP